MYAESIDQKQCLCYSQDKLLEKQTQAKKLLKAVQRRSRSHRTLRNLNNSAWFIKKTINHFFDGKVGDALDQLL